jgi:hypothetical protein
VSGSEPPGLRYGLDISPLGAWGDPRTLADLAALAERSGWDAVLAEDYASTRAGSRRMTRGSRSRRSRSRPSACASVR